MKHTLKKLRDALLCAAPLPSVPTDFVLCYHSLDAGQTRRGYVSPHRSQSVDAFVAQLQWLSTFARFVSLELMLNTPQNESSDVITPPDTTQYRVAITFDDGYRDNLYVALPELEKFNAPMTLFVTTDPVISRQLPWWDFQDWTLENNVLCDLDSLTTKSTMLSSAQRLAQRAAFRQHFRDGPQATRQAQLEVLMRSAGCTQYNDFMTSTELRTFADHPLTHVAAHTHQHFNTALLSHTQLRQEIDINLNHIEDMTAQRPSMLAYPYGAAEQIPAHPIEVLRTCAIDHTFSTTATCVSSRATPWPIPRLIINPGSTLQQSKAKIRQMLFKHALTTW